MPEALKPSISIVTPSFNQGKFLEETIRSVLGQGYPNLEYVVMDGGSKDDSAEIIRKYSDKLTFWTSEKDGGHYDAVNRGFAHTTGEIMAWINSDDKYTPWAFSVVAEIFSMFPQVEWLTSACPMHWDGEGRAVACFQTGAYNRKAFFAGTNLPAGRFHVGGWIQQESTFWRRSLWERSGGALSIGSIAGDFELWTRFFAHAPLHTVSTPLGGFRTHGNQISVYRREEYLAAAEKILKDHDGRRFRLPRRLLRALLHTTFGGRHLNRLPKGLAGMLVSSGLLFQGPLCRWNSDQWEIVADYVF